MSLFMVMLAPVCSVHAGSRPMIFIKDGTVKELKYRLRRDSVFRLMHDALITRADTTLQVPLPRHELKGRRMLHVSRAVMFHVMDWSYAYLMTGDKKYARRAEQEMLAAAAFDDWNPSHFLDVAEMTLALSTGYSWLYNVISKENRNIIAEAIYNKGLIPSFSKENEGIFRSDGNWNQVCNAGMVCGAAAVMDRHPRECEKVIDRALIGIKVAMDASYSPQGVFPEGPMYAVYGTGFNILMIEALRNMPQYAVALAEVENYPGFLEAGRFMLHTTTNSGRLWPYGDCQRFGNNQLLQLWFSRRTNDPGLLHHFLRMTAEKPSSAVGDRYSAAILMAMADVRIKGDDDALPLVYEGQGPKSSLSVLRQGWDKEDTFAGLKGGSPLAGHSHLDAGAVVVERYGTQWLTDPGMVDYTDTESCGVDLWNQGEDSQRWEMFRINNQGHSTLTFGPGHSQKITAYSPVKSDKERKEARIDMSDAYSRDADRCIRTMRMEDNGDVTLCDSITSPDRFTYVCWTGITEANASEQPDGSILLTDDMGHEALLKVDTPFKAEINVGPAIGRMPYDVESGGMTKITFCGMLPQKATSAIHATLEFLTATGGNKSKDLTELTTVHAR